MERSLDQMTMEHLGVVCLKDIPTIIPMDQPISEESASGTIPSWELENLEESLGQLTMVLPWIMRLLELQIISMESASGIVPSWQLEMVERSLNQLIMVHLGVIHLLEEIPSGLSLIHI